MGDAAYRYHRDNKEQRDEAHALLPNELRDGAALATAHLLSGF
jgi:hypothetical protein